jgi:hypothetical protein
MNFRVTASAAASGAGPRLWGHPWTGTFVEMLPMEAIEEWEVNSGFSSGLRSRRRRSTIEEASATLNAFLHENNKWV